ncbi:Aspergillopepsin-2 [Cytospora mali]|uniref:Aspergillopepsin-2 n=1 Tax=Cytospora mali TaxID=578113 RepID=A0A194VC32_CYTMA|nr:Aspergillopepsin-2 [Valsa mali var. pyri (nom. inval.)]
MKFSTLALLATAEVALGARLTEHRRARHEAKAAKRASQRNSQPRLAATDLAYNETSHVSYSTNWAGAVLIGTDYESVTGTITVPTPSAGYGSSTKAEREGYCASAWVGIDGDTCTTAILQTGVDFCYDSGDVSYDAWYEWYPDYAYDFDLSISSGDVIVMTVTATSESKGTAVIENSTTGKSVTHTFSSTEGDLCQENAEWIVEDFEEGLSLVPFADFDEVEFTDAYTTKSSGTTETPASADILDIRQSGEVLTSCSASGETVTCTYTG